MNPRVTWYPLSTACPISLTQVRPDNVVSNAMLSLSVNAELIRVIIIRPAEISVLSEDPLIPLAMVSAFTKGKKCFSAKSISASVDFPEPLGPAMIISSFFKPMEQSRLSSYCRELSLRLFSHDLLVPSLSLHLCAYWSF